LVEVETDDNMNPDEVELDELFNVVIMLYLNEIMK